MKEEIFYSKITDGRMSGKVAQDIARLLKIFEGVNVFIKIGKVRKPRSLNQNGYYRGVICKEFMAGALDMWGEHLSNADAHEYLKQNCNYKEVINLRTNESVKLAQTTTDHNTLEAEEYYEKCRKLIFTYFGIMVPLPNEQVIIRYE